MHGYESPEENQPILWLGGHALYAVHVLVLIFCASMVVTSLLMFAHAETVLSALQFSSVHVLKGQVWRVLTYGLVNQPSISFAINMLMMVWFGREVEKYFGRRNFLLLYLGIYLLPPLLFTALGFWTPQVLAGEAGALALFIAFATLYPNVTLLFNILAKWAAVVIVGISTLIAFAYHDWISLLSLVSTAGFAFGFVRYQQGRITLPKISLPAKKPKFRTIPDLKPERIEREQTSNGGGSGGGRDAKASTMVEIDAILDKIAKSGLSSLTAKERTRLDNARNDLRRRKSESG